MLLNLFRSRITYRVHGAAHPSALRARRLALQMALLAIAERRVMSRTPAESLGPERTVGCLNTSPVARKTGGRRSGDDMLRVAKEPPAMAWRKGRVYVAGDERGYETLAAALAAWKGRAA